MLLTTPTTIRTLQRKLYTKAKQEPAYRFYALYDKVSREDILGHAWRLVRANRGRSPVYGISFEAIENGEGVETFLLEPAQMQRHQGQDRRIGDGRFPSVGFYRRYGLYKVPTAAGWKSAHALV
jgi:hypothetical protein